MFLSDFPRPRSLFISFFFRQFLAYLINYTSTIFFQVEYHFTPRPTPPPRSNRVQVPNRRPHPPRHVLAAIRTFGPFQSFFRLLFGVLWSLFQRPPQTEYIRESHADWLPTSHDDGESLDISFICASRVNFKWTPHPFAIVRFNVRLPSCHSTSLFTYSTVRQVKYLPYEGTLIGFCCC